MFLKKMKYVVCAWAVFSPLFVQGESVAVTNGSGECFFIEVDAKSTLKEVADKVAHLETGGKKSEKILVEMDFGRNGYGTSEYTPACLQPTSQDVWNINAKKQHGQFLGTPRNYYISLTNQETGDIRYIITTLANRSLISIAKCRDSLQTAGDRIDHIHPLRFLFVVFSDEELKVGIRNIRGRGWIWGDFISGIKESLTTESSNNNMCDEYVIDFANQIGIDPNIILPAVHAQNWDALVEELIVHVPRKGDHSRFDS